MATVHHLANTAAALLLWHNVPSAAAAAANEDGKLSKLCPRDYLGRADCCFFGWVR